MVYKLYQLMTSKITPIIHHGVKRVTNVGEPGGSDIKVENTWELVEGGSNTPYKEMGGINLKCLTNLYNLPLPSCDADIGDTGDLYERCLPPPPLVFQK